MKGKTRLVRVRGRSRAASWAVVLLAAAAAIYIRVSLPAAAKKQTAGGMVDRGERVTREVTIEPLAVYLVSFGGYDARETAGVEAARYVSRGAAGYVLDDERLEVIGAGYARREDAERVAGQLSAGEGISCRVIDLENSGLTLRMTAGSGQITAFLEAERALRSAAGAMGEMAFSLDKGEATVQQAAQVVSAHRERVKKALKELEDQAGGSGGALFSGLARLMQAFDQQASAMGSEARAMALSSRLKYCSVDMRVGEIEMLNGLAGGEK